MCKPKCVCVSFSDDLCVGFVSWYCICIGCSFTRVTYLTEIIPRKGRGIAVQSLKVCAHSSLQRWFSVSCANPLCYHTSVIAHCQIFYVLGGILIIGVGMAMVPSVGWRWYLATSAIFTLPLMIVSFVSSPAPKNTRANLCMQNTL